MMALALLRLVQFRQKMEQVLKKLILFQQKLALVRQKLTLVLQKQVRHHLLLTKSQVYSVQNRRLLFLLLTHLFSIRPQSSKASLLYLARVVKHLVLLVIRINILTCNRHLSPSKVWLAHYHLQQYTSNFSTICLAVDYSDQVGVYSDSVGVYSDSVGEYSDWDDWNN